MTCGDREMGTIMMGGGEVFLGRLKVRGRNNEDAFLGFWVVAIGWSKLLKSEKQFAKVLETSSCCTIISIPTVELDLWEFNLELSDEREEA